jgi:hypothetical protein
MIRLEDDLAAALDEAAHQIAHAECFDLEQRAEVYTILHAIQTDTAAHRQIVGQWVNDTTGTACHV